MQINFNYPKLAKEKFLIALDDRLTMTERYEALKFVKLYVDQLNLDFFNFFLFKKRAQKHGDQRWFYDNHKFTFKDNRGYSGAYGVYQHHVPGASPDEKENTKKARTWQEIAEEYVPDPDYSDRFD